MDEISSAKMRKIQGLLALANHASTSPVEAQSFREKAISLMARYCIDLSMLEDQGQKRTPPTSFTVNVPGPYAARVGLLLNAISRGFGCRTLQIGNTQQNGSVPFEVFGFANDLDIVWMLYENLYVQLWRELEATGVRTKSFRNGFIAQYAAVIGERVEAMYSAAVAEAPGTDLVLASRVQEVGQALSQAYPDVVTRKVRSSDLLGQLAGMASGERADIAMGSRLDGPAAALTAGG